MAAPDDLPLEPTASYNPDRTAVPDSPMPTKRFSPVQAWLERSVTAAHRRPPEEGDAATTAFQLYKFLALGGCGEVWEAEQASLARSIAVKRIRPELLADSREAVRSHRLAEFCKEAFTAGRLEHPNIVPVYDFGVDEKGAPLLAMKLVRGRSWDKIIQEEATTLPVPEFLDKHLEILIAVSRAVAYAHSRGIVHRDLKPTQVMTGEFGEVLLMDWGLALFTSDAAARDATAHSELIGLAPTPESATNPCGTVAFMAPEQTEGNARNIGPWTDVYLLGGTLYYLLTGETPHQGSDTRELFARAQLGEVVPPGEAAPDREQPRELQDLALQAMAARREDRVPSALAFVDRLIAYRTGANRRRESEALAADLASRIERAGDDYALHTELTALEAKARSLWPENPALAGLHARLVGSFAAAALRRGDLSLARVQADQLPAGAARQSLVGTIARREAGLRRLHRQRRLAVASIAAAIVVIGLSVFYSRLAEERARQEQATARLLDELNRLRHDETALAEEIDTAIPLPDAIVDLSGRDRPDARLAAELVARADVLHARRAAIATDPLVAPRLDPEPFQLALARATARLATASRREELDEAYRLFESAAARRRDLPEPLVGMGVAAMRASRYAQGTAALERAASLVAARSGEKSMEHARVLGLAAEAYWRMSASGRDIGEMGVPGTEVRKYGERSVATLEDRWAELGIEIAKKWQMLGEVQRAVGYTSGTLPVMVRLHGERSAEAAYAESQHAEHLAGIDRLKEAKDLAGRAVEALRALPGEHRLDLALALVRLDSVTQSDRQTTESLARLDEALRLRTEVLGPDDGLAVDVLARKAIALGEGGRYQEALKVSEEVVERRKRFSGPRQPETANAMLVLAFNRDALGDSAGAEPLFREAIDILKECVGPDHMMLAEGETQLALCVSVQGRLAEAEELYRDALRIRRKVFGSHSQLTALSLNNLAYNLYSEGKMAEALELFREAFALSTELQGTDNPETIALGFNAAMTMGMLGDFEESEAWCRKVQEPAARAFGREHPTAITFADGLGTTLTMEGKYREAEAVLRDVAERRLKALGPDSPPAARSFLNLAEALVWQGRFDEAVATAARAREVLGKGGESQPPARVLQLSAGAAIFAEAGRRDEASRMAREALALALEKLPDSHPLRQRAAYTFLRTEVDRLESDAAAAGDAAIIAARQLDGDWKSAPETYLPVMALARGRNFATGLMTESRLLRRLGREPLAVEAMARAGAMLEFAGAAPDNFTRKEFDRRLADFPAARDSCSAAAAKARAGREALWGDSKRAVPSKRLWETIDAIAPACPWEKEFPSVAGKGIADALRE